MPPPAAFFLGIDVARSGLGLVILAGDGRQVATLRRAYGSNTEQLSDPQDWWRAARTGIKEILRRAELRADQIRCIGVTGDSDGTVALSKDGRALSISCLGPDPRADAQVDQLNKTVGARNLLNLASGPAHSGAAAVKLLWLRENEKRAWHDLGIILSPKDFLRYRLCETAITDASDAAATLLFNPKTRAWSKQLLTLLEINPAWLPSISSGQLISGRVTATASREAGLQAGTPVITGGGHAASSAISAGILGTDSMMVELGGIGGVFAPTKDAIRDPSGRLNTTCHSITGTWALTQSDLASAEPLDWLQQHVFSSEVMQAKRSQRDALEPLAELAAETPTGSDGLIHLSTKQSPHMNGFIGLNRRHGRGHLVRAVLESGAFSVRSALNALVDLKRDPETILVVGAGASNTLWCQILADALNRQIHAIPGAECAATGAAILAGSAVGLHKNVPEACSKMVGAKIAYQPRKAANETYQSLIPILARLLQVGASAFANETLTAEGQA
jgi:xylulokinase